MVDLEYVKRRKKRTITALITAIGSVIVAIFIIVSFLGQNIGTFTVNLNNSEVKLSLSETSDFKEPTSYLRVSNVEPMDLHCYQYFKDSSGIIDFKKLKIDDESTTFLDFARKDPETQKILAIPFFKYTFFVRNEGELPAKYTMSINITENTPDPLTKRTLDGMVRLIVIENGKYDRVIGKRSNYTHYDPETGEENDLEYICGAPGTKEYEGQCYPFQNDKLIYQFTKKDFSSNEITRYTLLYWLEGDDYPDAYGDKPSGSKLRLGVEIQAYEN